MSRDETIEAEARDKLWSPSRYRVMILGSDDSVLRVEPMNAETNEEAITQARTFVGGHAVELWDGVRFIEHFKLAS